MLLFFPVGWDPDTNDSILSRYPAKYFATLRRELPGAEFGQAYVPLLHMIYLSVAHREASPEEILANRLAKEFDEELWLELDRLKESPLRFEGWRTTQGVAFRVRSFSFHFLVEQSIGQLISVEGRQLTLAADEVDPRHIERLLAHVPYFEEYLQTELSRYVAVEE